MLQRFFAVSTLLLPLVLSNLYYYNVNFTFGQGDDLTVSDPTGEDAVISPDNNISSTSGIQNNANNTFLIQLKSRQFIPDPGVNVSAIIGQQEAENKIHFLLQLYKLPTSNETKSFEQEGIALLHYLTGNTYIASSNVSDVSKLPKMEGVRWAGPLQPADKISDDLKERRIGIWAQANEVHAVLTIQFHNDTKVSQAEDIIRKLGGNVTSVISIIPSITAVFPLTQVQSIALEDAVQFVDVVSPPLEETNDAALTASNVIPLYSVQHIGTRDYPHVTGSSVTALIYDGGRVDSSHPDFRTRIVQTDTSAPLSDHATHVGGTFGGNGANSAGPDSAGNPNGGTASQWQGVAPSALIRSFGISGSTDVLYDSGGDLNTDFTTAATNGIDLATMSLNNNVVRNMFSCNLLGDYANTAILIDNIVRGSIRGFKIPYFEAAGNERGSGAPCGTFSTISSPATSKNSIAVGAINSNDNSMTMFSSWGPTDDGRLKPDIVAPGCQVGGDRGITSTSIFPSNGYLVKCGTSMATPVVAGTGALLIEQWNRLQYMTIPPSTVKAILIHKALDLGAAGPDYQFGWGRLDANGTINHVRQDNALRSAPQSGSQIQRSLVTHDTVDPSSSKVYVMVIQDNRIPRITLAWDDPPATRLATTTLINDLDVRMIDPDGIIYSPFVLNTSMPAAAATTGNDNVNNVEMVLGNAKPGVWLVRISGDGIALGRQMFSLISSHGLVSLDQVRPEIRLTQVEAGPAPGTTNTVNLLGIPLPVTTLTSASFSFTARSDFGITDFECRLNDTPPQPCGNASGHTTESGTITYPSVNEHNNIFRVTAVDTLNKRATASFGWYVCPGSDVEANTCLEIHQAVWRASFEMLCPGDCKFPPLEEVVKHIKDFHPEYTNITSTDIAEILRTGMLTDQIGNTTNNLTGD